MESESPPPILKCKNIVASVRGLAEVDGKKLVLFVPTAEIGQVVLKFGKTEHRPMISLSIGIMLALVGVAGLKEMISVPRGWRYELGMIFFGVVGATIIFDGLKERYFLEVHKAKGHSRLVFSKGTSAEEVRDFCEKVRATYKYKVTEEV